MTQDPAASKVDTGPLPALPAAPPTPPNRRSPRALRWVLAAGAGLLLALIGLLILRPPDPMADPRPLATVRGFVSALEARDATRMLSYVEPTVLKKQIGPELRAYVEYIRELRFEDARYELLASDGREATVRLTATMRYTVDYGQVRSGERAVDATYELRNVEGAWYLSGVGLPAAQVVP